MEQATSPALARPKTVSDVREHVIETFNQAVRRPGMYYGDRALGVHLDMLAYLDGEDDAVVRIVDTNQRSVLGAVAGVFPGAAVTVEPSLVGEEAFRHGWLRLSRELTEAEYSAVVDRIPMWQAGVHLVSDVLLAHGPASVVFGATNPAYPTTIAYATEDHAVPMVFFYFGHRSAPIEFDPSARASLLAIRVADKPFPGGRLFSCQDSTSRIGGDSAGRQA